MASFSTSSSAVGVPLLAAASARIPTAGKIRPGIKVLTRRAAGHPQARQLYDHGVAAGHSFERIERAIAEAVPELKQPLIPRNVPWFTVREGDFAHPEIARQILKLYGEAREGDNGVRRLYRFPVVFPSDDWQTVMPHELSSWGANDKRFWSQYSADGLARQCMQYAPVPTDSSGQRVIRLFGGRKAVPREERGGLCDPENCQEYQQRQCNLSGRLLFFIPGIAALSAFELPTHSFYALNGMLQKFKAVAFLRGGRISGFLDAQRTPFYLSKRLVEVPHIDEHGQAVRVQQWIIDLEAPVDVTALLRQQDDEEHALAQAQLATQLLEGNSLVEEQGSCAAKGPEPVPQPASVSQGRPTLMELMQRVRDWGIDPQAYRAYGDRRWGPGWRVKTQGRMKAWDELERYRNAPMDYADKISVELRLLSQGDAS